MLIVVVFLFFFSVIQMKFILAVSLPMARYSRLDRQKPKQLFVFIKYNDICGQFKSIVSRTWHLMTASYREHEELSLHATCIVLIIGDWLLIDGS